MNHYITSIVTVLKINNFLNVIFTHPKQGMGTTELNDLITSIAYTLEIRSHCTS